MAGLWWLVRGSWAVTKGQDVRRKTTLRAATVPGLECMYAELFVLWRKASTNYHHTTPLSLTYPSPWKRPTGSVRSASYFIFD